MKTILGWICIVICTVFSEEKSVLSITSGESAGKVADCVDVISGSFYLSKEDISIIGADPITFQSTYISQYPEAQFVGWYFFNHLHAFYQTGTRVIIIRESDGSSFVYREVFRKEKEEKSKPLFETKKSKKKRKKKNKEIKNHNQKPREMRLLMGNRLAGFTNTSKEEMSGRYNIKNNKLQLSADYAHLYVYQPNGVQRIYEKEHHPEAKTFLDFLVQQYSYRLIEERFPTGRKARYLYDHKDSLAEIRSCSFDERKTYAWMKIRYAQDRKKSADFTITTSDGCIIKYHYDKTGKTSYGLKEIQRVDFPNEKYAYAKKDQSQIYLTSRQRADQRSQHINYYEVGDHYVQNRTIHISSSEDPRHGRVKSLQMPVGENGELRTVYEFVYEVGEVGKTGGKTYVYDVDQNVSIYSYSSYLRLETVEKYDKEKLIQKKRFVWGKEGTSLESNLICLNLYDGEKNCVRATQYYYDSFDNVIEEKAFGNFSGKSPSFIQVDQEHFPIPHSSECVITRRSYSQDGKNLLLEEEKENGLKIEYRYHPITLQITAKFIKDHENIRIRYGYEYDEDQFLIREICDDGISRDIQDLTGVTQRKIQQMERFQIGPFIGMVQSIQTKFLDMPSNRERLFQNVVFHYSNQGKIVQQDYYDEDERFVYSLFYTYDDRRRIVSKTDPLGQKTKYRYDPNYNCIEEKDTSKRIIKTYNRVNQVIHEKKISKEGIEQDQHFTYNVKGRPVQITDSFANTTIFTYDYLGNQTSIQLPNVFDEKEKIRTPTFSFEYDCLGNQTSHTDANQNRTLSSYNSYNQPYQIIYPDGSSKSYVYNLDGTLQSETDSTGVMTLYQYDFLGRNISTEVLSKNQKTLLTTYRNYSSFHLLSEIDAEGFIISYTYNHLGKKILEEREKEKKEFIYDALGREHKVVCEDIVEVKEYDLLDRCILEAVEDLKGEVLQKKEYEYDEQGNRTAIIEYIENHPVRTTTSYDGFNRVTEKTNPFQETTIYTYEKVQNALGQQVLQTVMCSPLGVFHQTTHDALQQVVSETIYDTNRQEVFSFSQKYDLNGNLVWRKDQEQITYFTYDALNRMRSCTEAYQTSKERKTEYVYNSKGQVKEIIKPDGTTLFHSYDDLDRLIRKASSDQTVDYSYEYNRLGHLISSIDQTQNSQTIREVDHRGRVLKERLANGLTTQATFDLAGRKRQLVLFDGSSIEYDYFGK